MLQAVIDHAPAVITVKDERGHYLLVNRSFEERFHMKREDVLGKTDHDLFPKSMADTYRANDVKTLQRNAAVHTEVVAPQDDGPHTYLSVKFPLPAVVYHLHRAARTKG
jgi:PAS domain S-box-containing protein